jgi:hypothetical protein
MKRWPPAPVCGTKLRPAVAPVALRHPPRHLSFFFSSAPQDGCIIHFNVYIYILIRMLENLCHYTHEPPCPQPQ